MQNSNQPTNYYANLSNELFPKKTTLTKIQKNLKFEIKWRVEWNQLNPAVNYRPKKNLEQTVIAGGKGLGDGNHPQPNPTVNLTGTIYTKKKMKQVKTIKIKHMFKTIVTRTEIAITGIFENPNRWHGRQILMDN